jgi:hypothetical protein
VEKGKIHNLEVKLKKMLDNFYQKEARRKQPKAVAGTGNIIRRREGEKDKRFSISNDRRSKALVTSS